MNYKSSIKKPAYSAALFALIISVPTAVFAAENGGADLTLTEFFIKICAGIIIAAAALRLVVMRIKREKPGLAPLRVITLPPEGVYPCETGYILRQYTDARDIASIFVQWMCDGSVIIEKGDGLNDTYLVKNKLDKSAPRYQILIYNELFRHTDKIPLALITSIYPSILKDTAKRIFIKYDEKHTRIFSKPIMIMQDAVLCAAAFPTALLIGLGVNESLDTLWLSALIGAAVFFAAYYLNARHCKTVRLKKAAKRSVDKNQVKRLYRLEKKARRLWLAGTVVLYAAVCSACILVYEYGILSVLAAITDIAALCIASKLESRSELGLKLRDELYSFKNYMANASAYSEKAEFRFNTEPGYYYRLLPFAYVLGVSNSWLNMSIYGDKKLLPPIEENVGEQLFSDTFTELTAMFVKCLSIKPAKTPRTVGSVPRVCK